MRNPAPVIAARSDLDWCWYLRKQGKAGEVIERALHDIGVLDPGGWADWQPSSLTALGSPVQVLFSEDHSDLQIVTEVEDPGQFPANRVTTVCALMHRFGNRQPSRALRDAISAAQATGALDFGARLGLRYGPAGLSCALLAELPGKATDLSALIGSTNQARLLDVLPDDTRVTMAGFDGATGAVTLHFATRALETVCLPSLAKMADVPADALVGAVQKLTRTDQLNAVPTRHLAVSFSDGNQDQAPVLTLGFDAPTLLGDDDRVSDLLRQRSGFAQSGYAALIETLPPAPQNFSAHGTVGVTTCSNGATALSIAVAAPWTSLDAGV